MTHQLECSQADMLIRSTHEDAEAFGRHLLAALESASFSGTAFVDAITVTPIEAQQA